MLAHKVLQFALAIFVRQRLQSLLSRGLQCCHLVSASIAFGPPPTASWHPLTRFGTATEARMRQRCQLDAVGAGLKADWEQGFPGTISFHKMRSQWMCKLCPSRMLRCWLNRCQWIFKTTFEPFSTLIYICFEEYCVFFSIQLKRTWFQGNHKYWCLSLKWIKGADIMNKLCNYTKAKYSENNTANLELIKHSKRQIK